MTNAYTSIKIGGSERPAFFFPQAVPAVLDALERFAAAYEINLSYRDDLPVFQLQAENGAVPASPIEVTMTWPDRAPRAHHLERLLRQMHAAGLTLGIVEAHIESATPEASYPIPAAVSASIDEIVDLGKIPLDDLDEFVRSIIRARGGAPEPDIEVEAVDNPTGEYGYNYRWRDKSSHGAFSEAFNDVRSMWLDIFKSYDKHNFNLVAHKLNQSKKATIPVSTEYSSETANCFTMHLAKDGVSFADPVKAEFILECSADVFSFPFGADNMDILVKRRIEHPSVIGPVEFRIVSKDLISAARVDEIKRYAASRFLERMRFDREKETRALNAMLVDFDQLARPLRAPPVPMLSSNLSGKPVTTLPEIPRADLIAGDGCYAFCVQCKDLKVYGETEVDAKIEWLTAYFAEHFGLQSPPYSKRSREIAWLDRLVREFPLVTSPLAAGEWTCQLIRRQKTPEMDGALVWVTSKNGKAITFEPTETEFGELFKSCSDSIDCIKVRDVLDSNGDLDRFALREKISGILFRKHGATSVTDLVVRSAKECEYTPKAVLEELHQSLMRERGMLVQLIDAGSAMTEPGFESPESPSI